MNTIGVWEAVHSSRSHVVRVHIWVIQLGGRTSIGLVEHVFHLVHVFHWARRIGGRCAGARHHLVLQAHVHHAQVRHTTARCESEVASPVFPSVLSPSAPGSAPSANMHLPRQPSRARALWIVPRGEVRFLRAIAPPAVPVAAISVAPRGAPAPSSSPSPSGAALAVASKVSRRADTAAPDAVADGHHVASTSASALATATTTAWRWTNANLEAVDEHLPGLEGGIGSVCCVLTGESHVHEILARNSRVGRLVAVHNLAELSHRPRDANSAVLGHDARGDSDERRHDFLRVAGAEGSRLSTEEEVVVVKLYMLCVTTIVCGS
mmetsp:Transcript_6128/g.14227  ORF Transcript_6128/g.14227 Transcript_6128/m.14227 type:complete len:322 (-) Transcript_6128:187-1152(-)